MLKFLNLDLRSLGLFRLLLGFVLLFDLLGRLFIINDFYTDFSAIPRGPLISDLSNSYFFSVFHLAGKSFYIYFLCFMAALSYLSLAIGYKTKIANFLSWFFFVSFSARAPILSHGGDDLIRLSLFWLFFLPSGSYFSIDQIKSKLKPNPSVLNLSSLVFVFQLITMYFFTALLKVHPRWMSEGSAIYYALELDQFLTSFGFLFRELTSLHLLKFLTQVTFWIELIVPFFIFIPIKNSIFRLISILTFIGFHFGLFLIFKLGTFPWICMIYWLALIPTDTWKKSWENKIESYLLKISQYFPEPFQTSTFYQKLNPAWTQVVVTFLFAIAFFWNIALHKDDDNIEIKGPLYQIGSVLRLHQHWNMFAPYPALNDGWVVVEGNLLNGKVWDVFNNKEFTTERPDRISEMFKGSQWRKYLMNISTDEYDSHRLYFGRYICRSWNSARTGDEKVDTFKVYFMLEKTRPPGEPRSEIQKQLIWDHYCFSKKNNN